MSEGGRERIGRGREGGREMKCGWISNSLQVDCGV